MKWLMVLDGDDAFIIDAEDHRAATDKAITHTGGGFTILREATEYEISSNKELV